VKDSFLPYVEMAAFKGEGFTQQLEDLMVEGQLRQADS